MGIRFNTNTWRAPLQLIDCWLPVHAPSKPASAVAMPRSLQNFVRAGWLKRGPASNDATLMAPNMAQRVARPRAAVREIEAPTCAQPRPTHSGPCSATRTDARLVISGRIGDVCAELERLAALELRTSS